jgi:streptomycin 6-kinase
VEPAERAEAQAFALTDVRIPAALDWWRSEPGGAEWLDRLPRLVRELSEQWELQVGAPFDAHISLVAPVTRADGSLAVLKVNSPQPDSEHEPHALGFWDGVGAARLLDHDQERRALLVEHCAPGDQLWSVDDDDEATLIGASVLRRLWRPPDEVGYRRLTDVAAAWAAELPVRWEAEGRPYERRLVDETVAWIGELMHTQPELVLAHQDLHGGNVLRSQREPWLAIDPQPIVAERAFDTASLLRDRRPELALDPHPERRLSRRLDLLSAELGLDRERMRGWAVVHAVAWNGDEQMIACARAFSSISP